jgi:hypothetical protein
MRSKSGTVEIHVEAIKAKDEVDQDFSNERDLSMAIMPGQSHLQD